MADYILTTNMGLTVPIVGDALGPDWANELNACLVTIDVHDHSQGKGAQITPAGMNINADFPLNANNLTLVRTVRFQAPSIQPALTSDLLCLYAFGADLYYRDGNGNQVRITQSGGVTGATGNITNLTAPASVTFVAGTSTFVFQSAANTSAIIDGASLILRNLVANSKGLTLSPPAGMLVDYTITLPALPVSTSVTTISSSGAMGTAAPDNATIEINAGVLQVKANGIGAAQVTNGFGLIPSGAMVPFGGVAAPAGYLLCDGTSYLRATYPNLFAAISTAYGAADGTHFNVPDFRGYFLRGVDGTAGRDPDKASRTAMNTGGNTGNNVGSVEPEALISHAHNIVGTTIGGGSSGSSSFTMIADNTGTNPTSGTQPNGGSETRPINAYVNYIIKT